MIEANQTERDGKRTRNDRLIAVAAESRLHNHVKSLKELNKHLIEEIEHFFISYNEAKGKRFKPRGQFGKQEAIKIVKAGMKSFASR